MADMQVKTEIKPKTSMFGPTGAALNTLEKSADTAGTAVDAIGRGNASKALASAVNDAAKKMNSMAGNAEKAARGIWEAARGASSTAGASREVSSNLQRAEQKASSLRRTLASVGVAAREASGHVGRMGRAVGGAWQTGVAIAESGYAAKAQLEKPISRERQYLEDANISGINSKELQKMDTAATKYGGGTLENARETRRALFLEGLSFDAAQKSLLGIQRTATATNLRGVDLAAMIAPGITKNFFTAEEGETILGMSANADRWGSFKFKDMSRAFTSIDKNGKDMHGVKGMAYHLANLETMSDVSGDSEETINRYEKLQIFRNSPEAARNLKKFDIDRGKLYQHAAANGDDMNMAFVNAIQTGIVEKDAAYRKLKSQATTATGHELEDLKRQLDSRQAELFEKVIGDKEARQGAIALANGGERRAELLQKIENNPSATVNEFFDKVQSSTQSRFEALGNTWETAMDGFFTKAKGAIDWSLETATGFMEKNPNGSVALAGATTVGGSLAAGYSVKTAWGFLHNSKDGLKGAAEAAASSATGAEGAATAVGTAPAVSKGTKAMSAAKKIVKVGGPLGLILAGGEIVATEMDDSLTREQKNIEHAGTAGGLAGGLAGAAAGAAVGSLLPVIGTAIGAFVGGLLGSLGGTEVGEKIGAAFFKPGDTGDAAQPRPVPDEYAEALQYVQQQTQQPINATIQLNVELDGDSVANAVEQRQLRESTRH